METYYAPPERADTDDFQRQLHDIGMNPIVSELMHVIGGLLAVLNEQRQVLAVNDAFMDYLGIKNTDFVAGLRPGEMIQCIHAHEMPGGCGTSRYCSTCGAAIAIVSSLNNRGSDPQKCVATVSHDGKIKELCLHVQARIMKVGNARYVLLFVKDITQDEWRAALERAFYHDISNVVTGLVQAGSLMESKDDVRLRKLVTPVRHLITRLDREIRMQKALASACGDNLKPNREVVLIDGIVQALIEVASFINPSRRVAFEFPSDIPHISIVTDNTILLRVLTNMVKNAFEASDEGDTIRMRVERAESCIVFSVWNRRAIPENIGRRVFQCHFSTKEGAGRGIGTFAMKLFGEKVLGGKVSFTSSEQAGTEFRFELPETA